MIALALLVAASLTGASGHAAAEDDPPSEPQLVVGPSLDDRPTRAESSDRVRSRQAFGGQTAGEALATLRGQHPGLVRPAWRASAEKGGHEVKRYVGDFAAVLDVGGGRKTLAESILPLRTTTASGDRVPVDFALEDRGDHVAPRAPLVAVRLPKRVEDGIKLAGTGIMVTPVAAGGGVAQGAEGSLFWGNAWGRDSDVIATPLPWGVQVLGQLRSANSPESFDLRIGVPEGARLERSLGGAGIDVRRGDASVGTVSAPVVFDADGVKVAASYELVGETMKIHVDHRSADVRYPLVLDPVVAEDQRYWNTNGAIDFNGWESGSVGATFNHGAGNWWMGRGLFTFDADTFYNNGNWGYWRFEAPGSESFIYAADFHYVRTQDQDTCLDEGITNGSGGWATRARWCNAWLNYVIHSHCAATGCPTNAGGARDNSAYFIMLAAYYNKYRDTFSNFTGGALLWLNDLTAPTLGYYGPAITPNWVDNESRTLLPLGIDWGLGIKQWKLSLPGQPDRYRTHDCAGHRNDRCPNTSQGGVTGVSPNAQRTSGDSFTYSTGTLPEGIVEVRGYAGDFTGNWSPPLVHYVKVDHSAPTIALSGTLAAAEGRMVNQSSVYRLHVDATDGTASDPRAGVKSIEIEVDGARQGPVAEQSCATDSCPMTYDWHFVPAAFAAGEHTITVKVRDQLDHEAVRSFKVDVPGDAGCGGGTIDSAVFTSSALTLAACPGGGDKEVAVDTRVRGDGAAASNYAGSEVANVGDVNGDGRPDFAVLAPDASTNGRTRNGAVYILFGRAAAPDASATGPNATAIALGSLGAEGFRIDGNSSGETLAAVVGLGDVNGDGRDDLAVSNSRAAHLGRTGGGWVFVVFGKAGTANVDLAALGSGGYRIFGAAAGDSTGWDLERLDDLNGDGRAEVAIGAPNADNNSRPGSGSVYVVYGKSTISDVDLASLGTSGFRIDGPPASHTSFGIYLLAAGEDFNGDAKPDVVVGNSWAGPNGRTRAGSAWVVFGQPGSGNVDLNAPGSRAYRVDGAVAEDNFGASATSAGDLNGDGIDELAIGAPGARNNHGGGSVYVIAGKPRANALDLREPLGVEGYRIDGDNRFGGIGSGLARLTDVNGDALPELAVGSAGPVYVVYGQATGGPVDLSLRTFNGYRVGGTGSSSSVADAGNFLATGAPALAIGDTKPRSFAGSVYFLDARPRVQ